MASTTNTDSTTQHTTHTDISILSLNVRGMNTQQTFDAKLPIIKNLIQTKKPDFLFLQETKLTKPNFEQEMKIKLNAERAIFSSGNAVTGTAVIQITNRWKIIGHRIDHIEARISSVKITRNNKNYEIINIYAPADPQKRKTFYENLNITVSGIKENIVLGGDLNTTLEDRDKTSVNNQNIGREELKIIVTTRDLKDSYRDIYPNITDFTWEQSTDKDSPKSRIDRFYVEKEEKNN